MIASPVVGLVLGFLAMVAIMWMLPERQPNRPTRASAGPRPCWPAAMASGNGNPGRDHRQEAEHQPDNRRGDHRYEHF